MDSHAEKLSQAPKRAVLGPVLYWLKSFAEPQGIIHPSGAWFRRHTNQVFADYGALAFDALRD